MKSENETAEIAPRPLGGGYVNYDVFDPDLIPLHVFSGPEVGERAPGFVATGTDGNPVSLSGFRGKTVVLETGSYTCPMHNGDIDAMSQLQKKYPGVVFLVLYVREAHPGEKIPGHRTMNDKIGLARKLEDNPGENRTILVDDVDGTTHQLYGALPNSVHIINGLGIVAFRSDWNNVVLVDQVLAELQEDEDARLNMEHYPKKPPMFSRNGVPVLLRGGWRAVWDMVVAVPGMIRAHKLAAASFPSERTFTGAKSSLEAPRTASGLDDQG